MINCNRHQKNAGIALLMTVMVLSVVLSVTLAIVELTLQQLALSVDSRDSEVAFHAANAGLECARYTRRNASTTFEGGSGIGSPISIKIKIVIYTSYKTFSNFVRKIKWIKPVTCRIIHNFLA